MHSLVSSKITSAISILIHFFHSLCAQTNLQSSLANHKAWAMLPQEQESYLLSKPLEQSLWTSTGSGSQLRSVKVKSGSRVLQSGLMVQHWLSPVCRSPMKGATAVSSTTMLVPRLLTQPNSVLVRIDVNRLYNHGCHILYSICCIIHAADPTRITAWYQQSIHGGHILPVSIMHACSWSPQNHYTSPRVERCCSRQMCNVQCWSHWNRTSELQMGVESCWRETWDRGVAAMWFGKLFRRRQFHSNHPQCGEVQWRELPLCHQQLCW